MKTKNSRAPLVLGGAALVLSAVAAMWPRHSASAEEMKVVPPVAIEAPASASGKTAEAVFAGGCFWGVQGVFQHVRGVTSAVAGYSGGTEATATYPVVSTGMTGHAESVKITYDPSVVSYGTLLQIYFSVVADPTQLNAQGPDEGTQYRSDIFATTSGQAKVATGYIAQLQKAHVFPAPIVTTVTPYKAFYPAESYHQNYLTNHPTDPYIAVNDIPKVEGLKRLFPGYYRSTPEVTAAK